MMHKRFSLWRGPMAATFILVSLIWVSSFFVTDRISRAEEEASFTNLSREAAELTHSLELNMGSDRDILLLIAEVLEHDLLSPSDLPPHFLDAHYDSGTFFSRLELLLPGDQIVTDQGDQVDASGLLSFEEEAALGAHISDRALDLDGESYVVRHFVPIEYEGDTVGLLYGVIELSGLDDALPYLPYAGQAAIYVIDGATGDLLIDTWHNEPGGNLWELGTRPLAEGYDHAQLRQGLVDGESNYVVFVSNTTGEYLYFYYTPLAINQWRVALSVPEDLVFSDARSIRSLLNLLLLLEGVFFLAYILWLIRYVRRETGEKQRQLDALNYIYDVEKLLFSAHEQEENVTRSLQVIGQMLPARQVSFTMLAGREVDSSYLWDQDGSTPPDACLSAAAPALSVRFSSDRAEISVHTRQEVLAVLPDAPEGMTDLAAIPVEDSDGTLRGVLSASGLAKPSGCAAMLRSVAFSFAMLCSNTRTYRALQRRGERDALTGLYNRNRYEADLPHLAGRCRSGLCCVYLDANGLHELNNSQGHQAGDAMLRATAQEINLLFGSQYVYRVGGDEFLIFGVDLPESEMAQRTRTLVVALEQLGFHTSAGVAWQSAPVENVELLVKEAERRMYAHKRAYYSDPAHSRRSR